MSLNRLLLLRTAMAISAIPTGMPAFVSALSSNGAKQLAQEGDRQEPHRSGDPWLDERHQHGQDRHAHDDEMMVSTICTGGAWFVVEGEGYPKTGAITSVVWTEVPDFTRLALGLALDSDATVSFLRVDPELGGEHDERGLGRIIDTLPSSPPRAGRPWGRRRGPSAVRGGVPGGAGRARRGALRRVGDRRGGLGQLVRTSSSSTSSPRLGSASTTPSPGREPCTCSDLHQLRSMDGDAERGPAQVLHCVGGVTSSPSDGLLSRPGSTSTTSHVYFSGR
jgi:hypothetical protein